MEEDPSEPILQAGDHQGKVIDAVREHKLELQDQWASRTAEVWSRVVAAYEADPTDLHCAWEYLQWHPVFRYWDLPEVPKSKLHLTLDSWRDVVLVYGWQVTDRGMDRAIVNVMLGEFGERIVSISHGPVVWIEDVDPSVTVLIPVTGVLMEEAFQVTASTWEQAVVDLAVLVRDRHGDERTRLPEFIPPI
ncbi:hypothetical protein [Arthrobacter sp. RAF14]|uniref:hypothetical protein n=1 Tax=Arthrobacter sp. RAF14 TaxID=3233051 RepID=UPI003F92C54B